MNIGDTITLKALGSATKRTKNRIHNRGVEWVQLDAIDNDWSGWLPIDEIEIINNTTTN